MDSNVVSAGELMALAERVVGKVLCATGWHPCRTNSDDSGVWGECVRCQRRFGYVDRAALRRFADAEAARAALAQASSDAA